MDRAPLAMRRVHGSRPLAAFHQRLIRKERPLATHAIAVACDAAFSAAIESVGKSSRVAVVEASHTDRQQDANSNLTRRL